jgi:hypothetical protein
LLYLALEVHVKHGKFSHFARNRPFLPGLLVVSPQNQVKRQDSASAECSNGNDHALIAARRTFPLVGPITARLLSWILGALETPFGAIMPKRGEAGAGAGAAAGGSAGGGGAGVGTTIALASASATPRRCANSVTDRGRGIPPARAASRAALPRARESTDGPCSGPGRTTAPAPPGADRSSHRPG